MFVLPELLDRSLTRFYILSLTEMSSARTGYAAISIKRNTCLAHPDLLRCWQAVKTLRTFCDAIVLQPLTLLLLDIPQMMEVLKGVVMEMMDCSLPLLKGECVGQTQNTQMTTEPPTH